MQASKLFNVTLIGFFGLPYSYNNCRLWHLLVCKCYCIEYLTTMPSSIWFRMAEGRSGIREDIAFMVFNYSRLLSDRNQSGNYSNVIFTSADILRCLKLFAKLLEHKIQLLKDVIASLDSSLQDLCHESLIWNAGTIPETLCTPKYPDEEQNYSKLENESQKSESANGCQISLRRLLLLYCENCETCRILAFQMCK